MWHAEPVPELPPLIDLTDVIQRVRLGEEPAAIRLVAYYEPMLRALIREWLGGTDRNGEQTSDFMQSLWGNAFPLIRRTDGDLHEPGALLSLLLTMVRQKVKEHHARLGVVNGARVPLDVNFPDDCVAPHDPVDGADLLAKVRAEIPQDLRRCFDLWLSGYAWPKIAEGSERSAEAIRKEISRRISLIAETLDLH